MSPRSDWSDLRVLVTGAAGGIGRPLTRRLLERGATVVVHTRKPDPALVGDLREHGARVVGVSGDLASLADVRALAATVVSVHPVDVVIHNAGVGFGADQARRETSRDGLELRFAVNYLAPFVLDRALLASPLQLRAIVHIASAGQEPLDLDDLQTTRGYDGTRAYRRSKLALVMHALDVAEDHPKVASNALHPGTYLDTGMVREAGIEPLGPPSRGVDAVAHVLDASLDGVTGTYFNEATPARANPQAYDRRVRAGLVERTVALVSGNA
jgi:NAD(P)-dependent dehydrogenase (short-subunit alcohol dehydrogenase family)